MCRAGAHEPLVGPGWRRLLMPMMELISTPRFIVSLLAAGFAVIFLATDGRSRTTRPLALLLLSIAVSMHAGAGREMEKIQLHVAVLSTLLEVLAILAGVEWGRRIGETAARGRLQIAANVLFRVSQALVLVYAGLMMGYIFLYPEMALTPVSGLIPVRGVEFAVFVPVLGGGMLLSGIALLILLLMQIDPAEKIRLRALLLSSPFLLAGLMVSDRMVPATLTIGLLVFFAGAVRYLQFMSQRGDFMRQFLSPEVARVVQSGGLDQVLRRERRPLSVVVCDLRGFTAYARQHDSDAVAGLLERFYAVVGAVSAQHGGTVKDHAGDGVLILVGAPLPIKDHAARSVQLARELRNAALPLLLEADGALGLGIGIGTGRVTVGAIRGAGRLEYVAVGTAVNLAARLCARAADGEILMDSRTRAALDDPLWDALRERPAESLKGFGEPVAVFALSGA